MKRLRSLLVLAVCLFSVEAFAQSHALVQVGDTNYAEAQSNLVPMGSGYGSSYLQMIFTPEQIGLSGDIDTIWFYCTGTGTLASTEIYMGATELDPGSLQRNSWVDTSQLQRVGEWSNRTPYSQSWHAFPLDSAFHYDGRRNLAVVVAHSGGVSYNCLWSTFRTRYAQSILRNGSDAFPGHMYGTLLPDFPRTRFSMNSAAAVCERTEYVRMLGGNPTMVTLGWSGETATELFEYELHSCDSCWDESSSTYLYDTVEYFNGLSPDSLYHFRVRRVCSPDYTEVSGWRYYHFRTPCNVAAIPFSESFEHWESPNNDCFYVGHNSATSSPAASVSSNIHSDSAHAIMLSAAADYSMWLSIPQLSAQVDFLQLSFDLYQPEYFSWPIPIIIGVMSDVEDLSTFDTLVSLYPECRDSWQHFEIPFLGFSGQGNRITFLVPQGAAKTIYLDRLMVDYAEYCARPIGLALDTLVGPNALVRWENGYGSYFNARYGEVGGDGLSTVPMISGDSVWLTNLLPGRAYFVQIQTDCDDDTLGWSDELVFHTSCFAPVEVGSHPYTELFAGYFGTPYASNEYNTQYALYNQQPYCWDFSGNGIADSSNRNFMPRIYRGSNVTSPNPMDNCLAIASMHYTGTSPQYAGYSEACGDTNYAVMPFVADSLHLLSISFSATLEGGDTLALGLWRNDSLFIPLEKFRGGRVDPIVALGAFDTLIQYGDRLAFRWVAGPSSSSSPKVCCLDDIVLETTGNCPLPLLPTLVGQSSQGTVLSWIDPYNTDSYEVRWGLSPSLQSASGDTVVDGSSVVLRGLQNGIDYYVWVRTLCDSSHSSWAAFAPFTTQCDTVTSYPYEDNFDSYSAGASGTLNPCWELSAASASAPMASTAHFSTAPNSLCLSAPNNSGHSMVELPYFDRPLSELQLSFDLYNPGTGETRLMIGTRRQISSNVYQQYYYDTIRMDYVPAGSWMHVVLPLDNYTSSGHLYLSNSRGNEPTVSLQNIYVDNLKVEPMPDCVLPRKPLCDSVTANAAYLRWQGNSPQYRVAFSENPYFLPDTCARFDTCSGTTFMLSNLQPSTTYYFRVQSLCDSNASEWSTAATFTTTFGCAVGLMTQAVFASPYDSYTFSSNSIPLGTNNTSFATAASWQIVDVDELMESNLHGGELNSVSLQYVTNTPLTVGVRIYLIETSLSQMAVPDTVALSLMTRVFQGNVAFSNANEWTEIRFDTPFAFSGESNLMIAFERTTACTAQGYFKSVNDTIHCSVVRRQSSYTQVQRQRLTSRTLMRFSSCADDSECPLPVDLWASEVTHNGAVVHWNSAHDTVDLLYGPRGSSFSQGIEISVVGDSATISGLSENTDYYFYVRNHCGTENQSRWSQPALFHTDFTPLPVPYFEDFDSSQVKYAFSVFPSNWDNLNANAPNYYYLAPSAYVDTFPQTFDYSGAFLHFLSNNSVYLYAIMPYLDAKIDTLSLNFVYRYTHATNTTLEVGVVHRDSNDFVVLDTVPYDNVLGFYSYDFGQSGISGRNYRIFFRAKSTASYGGFIMDDLQVDYRGGCGPVHDVELSWVSDQSAQISWQGNAPSYSVRYSATPSDPASWVSDTVSTNSILLSNLVSNTLYRVNIRTLCQTGAQLEVPFTFSTECGAYMVPFIPDLTENTPDPPSCWTFIKNSTIGWTIYSNRPGEIGYFPARPYNDWAVSPKIMLSGTERLHFVMLRTSGSGSMEAWVRVYVGSFDSLAQPIDQSNFQVLGPHYVTSNSTTGDTFEIDLAGYTGLTSFAFVADTSTMGIGIRDVRVESYICPMPTIELVEATPISALVRWTGGIVAQGQWRLAGSNNWSDTLNFDPTVDSLWIEGLDQGTDYEFRLRSICVNGLESDWSVLPFSTLPIENCFAPRLTLIASDFTSAEVAWQDTLHTQWLAHIWNNTYDRIDTVSNSSMTYEGLIPDVCYSVALQSFCGFGYMSEWGDTLTFCTPKCEPVSQVEVSVNGTSATVVWQPVPDGPDHWQVAYGPQDFLRDEGFRSEVLTTNSYLIEDLTPGSAYDVYVRGVCQDNIYSAWSTVVSFTVQPVGVIYPQVSAGKVRLFPNPATNRVEVSSYGAPIQEISLFDATGRSLRNISFRTPVEHTALDLDELPTGAYFLRVTRDNKSDVLRLVVK